MIAQSAHFYARLAWLLANNKVVTDSDLRRDYDRVSTGYDDNFTTRIGRFSREMIERLALPRGARVLDLACGTGTLSLAAAEAAGPDGEVIAVDQSRGMLEVAADRARRAGHRNIVFQQGDMQAALSAIPDGSLDAVTCGWAIGYVRPVALLRAAQAKLKPGGKVGLIENTRDTLGPVRRAAFRVARTLPGNMRQVMDLHLRLPRDTRQIERWFRRAGLRPFRSWSGEARSQFASGRDVLDWVMHTGASAGFDAMMDSGRKTECDELFVRFVEDDALRDGVIEVGHRFVAGLAARPPQPSTLYVTGPRKQAALLRTLGSPDLRRLPLRTLLAMRPFIAREKLTRLNGRYVINSFLPPFPSSAFDTVARGVQALRAGRAIPVSAYVGVTNRCRYRCWHCSRHLRPDGAEMSLRELTGLAADLQSMGVAIIGLTGGEPLLRQDLETLLASIDDRSTTLLFTSGDGLTPQRAAALKAAGLFGAAVSLDHVDPVLHDRRRGREGAYTAAVGAVRAARAAGLYTMIQLVATREMLEGALLDRYLALAAELGVHEIRLLEPMPTGRLMHKQAQCGLNARERETLREVHRRTNADPRLPKVSSFAEIEHGSRYGCGAGFQHLYVDGSGNVSPCDFVPVSFGNVRDEPVRDIWQRMNKAFGKPRRGCFLLEKAAQLDDAVTDTLPIPYEDACRVCCFENKGDAPAYYKAVGR